MLNSLVKFKIALTERERGATAVEYGLMVALIAIVIIASVWALGDKLDGLFTEVAASL